VTASKGLAPRRAALNVLTQVRSGRPLGAALDGALRKLDDDDDRRLAHEMAAGVLRRQQALDARLSALVTRDWSEVPSRLQDLLRLGAYQLVVLDRVPAHAAVDTSVSLAREEGGPRAGGFVNAVLRRLGAQPEATTAAVDAGADLGDAEGLARRHSHPLWLVERWLRRFGPEQTRRLLEWNDRRPRLVLQPARQGVAGLDQRWRSAGIAVEPAPYGAGLVTDRRRPEELPGFAEGAFLVQDPAQALLAWYADLPTGATVYDAAASPGGKTIALGREARLVVAGDLSRHRVDRLKRNLQRAGSGREHPIVADARRAPVRSVDAVLLDAPCLGTGTFARHPDARSRVTASALGRIIGIQRELLDALADVVAPAGLLIYSTCSLEPEENELQVDNFLTRHPEFRREPSETFPEALLSEKGDMTILPQRHEMDGAYAARLRRA
jgi:16S rRNA (cytosine967-C5)-methyltransferase